LLGQQETYDCAKLLARNANCQSYSQKVEKVVEKRREEGKCFRLSLYLDFYLLPLF